MSDRQSHHPLWSGTRDSLVAILTWWVPLTLLTTWARFGLGLALPDGSTWVLVEELAGDAALIFPFTAFVGGLARWRGVHRSKSSRLSVALPAAILAGFSYLFGSILGPVAELQIARDASVDVAEYYPMGAYTPRTVLRQRQAVLELGPIDYSFATDQPLRHPPNWLLFGLHQSIVFAAFGVMNALLGLLVGRLTFGLPPPVRRRRRWLAALVSAGAFFAVAVVCDRWATMSPDAPAILLAWLPLFAPLALGGMLALAGSRKHSSGQSGA